MSLVSLSDFAQQNCIEDLDKRMKKKIEKYINLLSVEVSIHFSLKRKTLNVTENRNASCQA